MYKLSVLLEEASETEFSSLGTIPVIDPVISVEGACGTPCS